MESFKEMLQALEEKKSSGVAPAGVVDFYRDVLLLQKAHLERSAPVLTEASRREAIARVERGQPATDGTLLEPDVVRSLASELAGLMASHGLVDGPQAGEDDSSDFIAAAAQFPFLKSFAEALLPHLNVSLWQSGICPICGASPAFAGLAQQTRERVLVCSRCGTEWSFKRLCCPFCNEERQELLGYLAAGNRRRRHRRAIGYRVFVCDHCRRYLKAIDLAAAAQAPISLFIESLLSEELDELGRRAGYRDVRGGE